MALITQARRDIYKAHIRKILIRNPRASVLLMQKLLHETENIALDKDYVNKLIREVEEERVKKLDQLVLKQAIASFLERIHETDIYLWKIITNDNESGRDRVSAAKELRANYKEAFELMFDAGVFDRKIGDVTINMQEVLEMAKLIEQDGRYTATKDKTSA